MSLDKRLLRRLAALVEASLSQSNFEGEDNILSPQLARALGEITASDLICLDVVLNTVPKSLKSDIALNIVWPTERQASGELIDGPTLDHLVMPPPDASHLPSNGHPADSWSARRVSPNIPYATRTFPVREQGVARDVTTKQWQEVRQLVPVRIGEMAVNIASSPFSSGEIAVSAWPRDAAHNVIPFLRILFDIGAYPFKVWRPLQNDCPGMDCKFELSVHTSVDKPVINALPIRTEWRCVGTHVGIVTPGPGGNVLCITGVKSPDE